MATTCSSGLVLPAVALAPDPARLVPGVALPRRDLRHQVHADEARPGLGLRLQLVDVERRRGLMRDDAVGHALLADACGERARVDAGQRDDAARLQPLVEVLGGAVVGGLRDAGAQHAAAHARAHRQVGCLGVLGVGADVADMREGEGDDLAGVGGVGEDLLIAGDRRIEAHLAHRRAGGAQALPGDDGAVGQHQPRRQRHLGPGFGPAFGHVAAHIRSPFAHVVGERPTGVNAALRCGAGGHK